MILVCDWELIFIVGILRAFYRKIPVDLKVNLAFGLAQGLRVKTEILFHKLTKNLLKIHKHFSFKALIWLDNIQTSINLISPRLLSPPSSSI